MTVPAISKATPLLSVANLVSAPANGLGNSKISPILANLLSIFAVAPGQEADVKQLQEETQSYLDALRENSPTLRRLAMEWLSQRGVKEALPMLHAYLEFENVGPQAARAIAQLSGKDDIAGLRNRLQSEGSEVGKINALRAILHLAHEGKLSSTAAAPIVADLIALGPKVNEQRNLLILLLMTVAKLGKDHRGALDFLLGYLDADRPAIRATAIYALKDFGRASGEIRRLAQARLTEILREAKKSEELSGPLSLTIPHDAIPYDGRDDEIAAIALTHFGREGLGDALGVFKSDLPSDQFEYWCETRLKDHPEVAAEFQPFINEIIQGCIAEIRTLKAGDYWHYSPHAGLLVGIPCPESFEFARAVLSGEYAGSHLTGEDYEQLAAFLFESLPDSFREMLAVFEKGFGPGILVFAAGRGFDWSEGLHVPSAEDGRKLVESIRKLLHHEDSDVVGFALRLHWYTNRELDWSGSLATIQAIIDRVSSGKRVNETLRKEGYYDGEKDPDLLYEALRAACTIDLRKAGYAVETAVRTEMHPKLLGYLLYSICENFDHAETVESLQAISPEILLPALASDDEDLSRQAAYTLAIRSGDTVRFFIDFLKKKEGGDPLPPMAYLVLGLAALRAARIVPTVLDTLRVGAQPDQIVAVRKASIQALALCAQQDPALAGEVAALFDTDVGQTVPRSHASFTGFCDRPLRFDQFMVEDTYPIADVEKRLRKYALDLVGYHKGEGVDFPLATYEHPYSELLASRGREGIRRLCHLLTDDDPNIRASALLGLTTVKVAGEEFKANRQAVIQGLDEKGLEGILHFSADLERPTYPEEIAQSLAGGIQFLGNGLDYLPLIRIEAGFEWRSYPPEFQKSPKGYITGTGHRVVFGMMDEKYGQPEIRIYERFSREDFSDDWDVRETRERIGALRELRASVVPVINPVNGSTLEFAFHGFFTDRTTRILAEDILPLFPNDLELLSRHTHLYMGTNDTWKEDLTRNNANPDEYPYTAGLYFSETGCMLIRNFNGFINRETILHELAHAVSDLRVADTFRERRTLVTKYRAEIKIAWEHALKDAGLTVGDIENYIRTGDRLIDEKIASGFISRYGATGIGEKDRKTTFDSDRALREFFAECVAAFLTPAEDLPFFDDRAELLKKHPDMYFAIDLILNYHQYGFADVNDPLLDTLIRDRFLTSSYCSPFVQEAK